MIIAAIEVCKYVVINEEELLHHEYDSMRQFATLQDLMDYTVNKFPTYRVLDILVVNGLEKYEIEYIVDDSPRVNLIRLLKDNKLIAKTIMTADSKLIWIAVE